MGKAELRKASHVVSLTRGLLILLGFATIFARASDGIGRKETTIVAWVFFGAFSLGGGLAKTLNQLIAFRVLQGIGGSGLYAMIMVVGPEITPLNRWGAFSGMLGMTIATGSVLGKLIRKRLTIESKGYRPHFRRFDYNQINLALDIFIQHPMCCDRNSGYALILASQQEGFQVILAVSAKGGLLRCSSPSRGFHVARICTPRSWKPNICVEQSCNSVDTGPVECLLGCLFCLDRLALSRQQDISYASNPPIARNNQSPDGPSYCVSCSNISYMRNLC